MGFIDDIYSKAHANPKRVALPEAANPVILQAAETIAGLGIATPVIVGEAAPLRAQAAELGIDQGRFEFADTADGELTARLVDAYAALPGVMLGRRSIAGRVTDPLYMALILEALGEVDCTFAGLDATTTEVILAGQTIIGFAPGITETSSFGVLEIEGFHGGEGGLLGFGDSAIATNPTSEELAGIAIACCDSIHALTDWTPRCALLSYSTCGSGSGPDVDRVVEAVAIARAARPDLAIDGEFQLDAAINPAVGAKKVKRGSPVAGRANIVIWPDLGVGNIGLKLVQQLTPSRTYGPVLQGFAKPVCDCSRGDTLQTVVDNIAMSVVMAGAARPGQ